MNLNIKTLRDFVAALLIVLNICASNVSAAVEQNNLRQSPGYICSKAPISAPQISAPQSSEPQCPYPQRSGTKSSDYSGQIINIERGEESARNFKAKSFALPYANVYFDTGLKLADDYMQMILSTIQADLELLIENFMELYYAKPIEIWILPFDIEEGNGFAFSFEDTSGRIITHDSLVMSKDYLRPMVEQILGRKIPALSYGLVAYFNELDKKPQVHNDSANIDYNLLSFFPLYFHKEYVGATISDQTYSLAGSFINFLLKTNTGPELIKLFVEDRPLLHEKQAEWYKELDIPEQKRPFWTDIRIAMPYSTYDFALETDRVSYNFKSKFIPAYEMTDEQIKLRDSGLYCLTEPTEVEEFIDTNLSMFNLLDHTFGNLREEEVNWRPTQKITYLVSENLRMQEYYDSVTNIKDDGRLIIYLNSPIYCAHIHELVHSLLNPAALISWGKEIDDKDLPRFVYLSEGLACYFSTKINWIYLQEKPEHRENIKFCYVPDQLRDTFWNFKAEQDADQVDNSLGVKTNQDIKEGAKHGTKLHEEGFAGKVYKNYIKKGGALAAELPLDYELLEEAIIQAALEADPQLEDDRFLYMYYESWLKFMADSYGTSALLQTFINNQDFSETFGMTFEESLVKWKVYIMKGLR